MAVVENLKVSNYKLLILTLKFIPMLTALCYMSSTVFNYLGYNIEPLSNIGGMSLLTWVFVYLSASVFSFCAYHKMFLWYILIDDLFNIVDYYWHIPLNTDTVLMLHNILIGLTLFIVLLLYVKSHKSITSKNNI